jgi:hypothetical protein
MRKNDPKARVHAKRDRLLAKNPEAARKSIAATDHHKIGRQA